MLSTIARLVTPRHRLPCWQFGAADPNCAASASDYNPRMVTLEQGFTRVALGAIAVLTITVGMAACARSRPSPPAPPVASPAPPPPASPPPAPVVVVAPAPDPMPDVFESADYIV